MNRVERLVRLADRLRRSADREAAPGAAAPQEVEAAARDPRNVVDDYVLVDLLGEGGHGVVYRAWQRSLGRWTAFKVMRAVGDSIERFHREARLAAKLHHPGIVPIYDVGEHEGRAYIVMQLVVGQSLDAVRLDLASALDAVRAAALAVQHAHDHGVVHRDLKPANLMLGEGGRVFVADFGLARAMAGADRITVTGAVAGTPVYMAPEQARGLGFDARTDVYALGATLYELVTGQPPFPGTSHAAVLAAVIFEEPVPVRQRHPGLSAEVEAVIQKAMEKAPERRYQTARAFAEDIACLIAGRPTVARPLSRTGKVWRWVKRHRLASAFVGLLVAAPTAFVVITARHAAAMSEARTQAEHGRRNAEEKLAQSLVSQGDSMALLGRWTEARDRYEDARAVFARLGRPPTDARLGEMAGLEAAPPPVQTLAGHEGLVVAAAFNPTGRMAVSGAEDGTARIWEVLSGRTLQVLKGHDQAASAVAWTEDGSTIATGDGKGIIRLWSADSGNLAREFSSGTAKLRALAFVRAGRQLLAAGEDGGIRLWDVASAKLLRSFAGHQDRVRDLDVSPDGNRFVSAGGEGAAIIWDLDSGRQVLKVREVNGLFTARFARDGQAFVDAGNEGEITRRRVSDGGVLGWTGTGDAVVSDLAYGPDGTLLAAAKWDGFVRLYREPDGTLLREIDTGVRRATTVAVSPDGTLLLAGLDDGLRIYDVRRGLKMPPRRHTTAGTTPAFSNDGTLALTWTDEKPKLLQLFDVDTKAELARLPVESRVARASFSRDGSRVGVATFGHRVMLWDPADDRMIFDCAVPSEPAHVAVTDDGERLWVGGRGGLALLDATCADGASPVFKASDETPVWRLATSPDGNWLATTGWDARVRMRSARTGELRWTSGALDGSGLSVAFSPDGARVIVGTTSGDVRVLDAQTGAEKVRLAARASATFGVSESLDGRLVATGTSDRMVRLWDAHTGLELRTLPAASDQISNLQFTNDGRLLAGIADGTVSVWDPKAPARHEALWPRVREAARKAEPSATDWNALGAWLAWQGFCAESVAFHDRAGTDRPPAEDLPAYTRCLAATGHRERAAPLLDELVRSGAIGPVHAKLLRRAR